MTISELLVACGRDRDHFQRYVNAFVDAFRRADSVKRREMIADGPPHSGRFEGLVAAVVSALCRETGDEAPEWVRVTHSPEPFFAMPARGFALRLRLMLEAPPPFRIRNVFVPENYLARA